jgi:hypothetical protein
MIRAIHNFGPPAGEYRNSASTDIRETFASERQRLAKQRIVATAQAGACVMPPEELHPELPTFILALAADERADLERARRQA